MVKALHMELYKTAYPKIGIETKILDTEFLIHTFYDISDLFKKFSPEIKPGTLYLMSICNIDDTFPFTKYYYISVKKNKTICVTEKIQMY